MNTGKVSRDLLKVNQNYQYRARMWTFIAKNCRCNDYYFTHSSKIPILG